MDAAIANYPDQRFSLRNGIIGLGSHDDFPPVVVVVRASTILGGGVLAYVLTNTNAVSEYLLAPS